MLASIEAFVGAHYIWFKFIHMLFAMIWVWSTSTAYVNYVVPVVREWLKNPGDPDTIRMRNFAMERFDDGVVLEHIAFPVLLITGPMLMVAGGWTTEDGWLAVKLALVIGLFIPIEAVDYHLSHFGGNKERVRCTGDDAAYERAIHRHWWFLVVTTPVIAIFAIGTLFLAIVKPF